jgi:membrane protein implicated in regulation of membrane protease activity
MEQWINELMSNPTALLVAGIIVVLIIFFVLKKLIKVAVVLFVILAVAAVIHYKTFEPKELMDHIKSDARELKEEAGKKIDDSVDKIRNKTVKDVKEKVKAPLSK